MIMPDYYIGDSRSALLDALLSLPDNANLKEFLSELGFDTRFVDLSQDLEFDNLYAQGYPVTVILDDLGLDHVLEYVPEEFVYFTCLDSDYGPFMICLRPDRFHSQWWLNARLP